jgi:hypothetical protein
LRTEFLLRQANLEKKQLEDQVQLILKVLALFTINLQHQRNRANRAWQARV